MHLGIPYFKDTDSGLGDLGRTWTLITLFPAHLSRCVAASNLQQAASRREAVSLWDRSKLAREELDSPSSGENSLAAERFAS